MQFLDRLGWPVERIKGRWFTNLIRLLIHTRKIKKGQFRRNDRRTLTISIANLTEPHAIALEDMFATWVQLGCIGSSRWTKFYADGDGNFRPRIMVNGRKAKKTDLVDVTRTWPAGRDGDYCIDFDWIAWALHDEGPQQPNEKENPDGRS